MKYVISGRGMQISEALEKTIRDQLGHLDRYFYEDVTADVRLSTEKGRHTVEITIPVPGSVVRCEQTTNDMYLSIDEAAEVIERQIQKYKGKLISNAQRSGGLRQEFMQAESSEEDEVRIVRRKQFDMKPMYPEDACVQMELLGHAFYMFLNAEDEQIAVVYRRKDGDYGMIEPEF